MSRPQRSNFHNETCRKHRRVPESVLLSACRVHVCTQAVQAELLRWGCELPAVSLAGGWFFSSKPGAYLVSFPWTLAVCVVAHQAFVGCSMLSGAVLSLVGIAPEFKSNFSQLVGQLGFHSHIWSDLTSIDIDPDCQFRRMLGHMTSRMGAGTLDTSPIAAWNSFSYMEMCIYRCIQKCT